MRVRDLIALLSDVDNLDREVIVQNSTGFSPMVGIYEASYKPSSPHDGIVGVSELSEEAAEAGYDSDDLLYGGTPAIIIFSSPD